jgi:RimJ/RimL family protein N-acetyltransferase
MPALPTLRAARLRLEPFALSHISGRYIGWLNNPENVRFSNQRHRRHTRESCVAYLNSFKDTPHYFMAIIADDPALGHIGNINAYVDEPNLRADVGILVGEQSVWGRGYGAEAWMTLCRHLLLERRLRKVTAGTVAANAGMLGIMKKCGMKPDGVRVRHELIDGEAVDVIHVALFREDLVR